MQELYIEQGLRLQKLIKALGHNQSSFARAVGASQPMINRMTVAHTRLSIDLMCNITKMYNSVNLHWLLTGQGPMFFDEGVLQVKEKKADYGLSRLAALERRVEELEKWKKEALKK